MSHGSPDSPTKICKQLDCERFVRARGLCVTHYNQTRPDNHAKTLRTCVVCGTPVIRGMKSDRRPTCSVSCRTALTSSSHESTPYDWALDAMLRARDAGATIVHHIERDDVFDRDGHRCYICKRAVTDPSPYDLASATVDHVIPLSRGGQHTMDNVATACLSCNSAKQDTTAAQRVLVSS